MSELHQPREFSGQNRQQGHTVPHSTHRKAIFVAGLAAVVIISALLIVSACVPTP